MNLDLEKSAWKKENVLIAFDEAGYGSAAGSMFIGAVGFPFDFTIPEELKDITDSKKLSEEKRFLLEPLIKKHALFHEVIEVTLDQINSGNVYHLRFSEPLFYLAGLHFDFETVYDGNVALKLDGHDNSCLVKGDQKCFSIACASILAKTAKDREMISLSSNSDFSYDKHKGYLTKLHQEELVKFGISKDHRDSYVRKYK